MNRKTIPLDQIRVASPCDVGWENMAGDDRVRFCQSCELHVYNIAAMSRREAEDLIRNTEGRLCVSLFRRLDGTVLTRDCPIGMRALRRQAARLVWSCGLILAGIVTGVAWFVTDRIDDLRERTLRPFETAATVLSPT